MTTLVFGRDQEVAAFVGNLLGREFVPPFTAIGVEEQGQLAGGAVFNTFTGPDVEISVAGFRCWRRGVFRAFAHYVFVQLGCVRCTVSVRANDRYTQVLAKKFGFRIEGVKRRGFGDQDSIIFGLLAGECRWLSGKE